MSELTLLTCTRNGSRMLRGVLEGYSRQHMPRPIDFDVLVVDNGSSDGTAEIAVRAIEEFGLKGRVVGEPRPGKINAFLRGLHEAPGELVSIVDDDNIVSESFVALSTEWFRRVPSIGMVGSYNRLGGVPSPAWFSVAPGRFACGSPSLQDIVQEFPDGSRIARWGVIAGAGSTFRRQPLLDALRGGFSFFNDTRRDGRMSVTGEDLELCWLFSSLGYWFVSDPQITVEHHISSDRLSWAYFRKLARSIGAGAVAGDAFHTTKAKVRQGRFGEVRCTWQWQMISRGLRLLRHWRGSLKALTGAGVGHLSVIEAEELFGAFKRILVTRSQYTAYMKNLVSAEWASRRVD